MPVVQPYYGLPPKEQRNFFADYLNAYLGTRTKQMQDEYARQMAKDDPLARLKLQQQLIQTASELDRNKYSLEQARVTGDYALAKQHLSNLGKLKDTEAKVNGQLGVAGIESKTRLGVAGIERTVEEEKMADIPPQAKDAADALVDDYLRQRNDAIYSDADDATLDKIAEKSGAAIGGIIEANKDPNKAEAIRQYIANSIGHALSASAANSGIPNEKADVKIHDITRKITNAVPTKPVERLTNEEILKRTPGYGGRATDPTKSYLETLNDPGQKVLRKQIDEPTGKTGGKVSVSSTGRPPADVTQKARESVARMTEGEPADEESTDTDTDTEVPEPTDTLTPPGTIPTDYTERALPRGMTEAMVKRQWDELQNPTPVEYGPTWDYSLKEVFAPRDPELEKRVDQYIRLRKEKPDEANAMMDAWYAAHPRQAKEAARGLEHAQEVADRGLALDQGPGGPPARRPITGASYGPEYHTSRDAALEAVSQSAKREGWDEDRIRQVAEETDRLWDRHDIGGVQTRVEIEEARQRPEPPVVFKPPTPTIEDEYALRTRPEDITVEAAEPKPKSKDITWKTGKIENAPAPEEDVQIKTSKDDIESANRWVPPTPKPTPGIKYTDEPDMQKEYVDRAGTLDAPATADRDAAQADTLDATSKTPKPPKAKKKPGDTAEPVTEAEEEDTGTR